MIIKKIEITHKNDSFSCEFTGKDHIYNSNSIQGKTTLIRFIIYGLGFDIPITHGLDPSSYKVTIDLNCKGEHYRLIRKGRKVDLIFNGGSSVFVVDNSNASLLSRITGCSNIDLLSNILGTFYIDQESGWMVFNRGKVISKQDYNIDRLIYSMSGLDSSIFVKKKRIEKEIQVNTEIIKQYTSQSGLSDYDYKEPQISDEIISLRQSLDVLEFDLKEHRRAKKIYESIKKQNDELIKLIDSLQLKILYNDEYLEVTRNNIVGFTDSQDLQKAMIRQEESIISDLSSQISEKRRNLNELLVTDEIDTSLYSRGARRSIKIDKKAAELNLALLKEDKKGIDESIEKMISDKEHKDELNKHLLEYAKILNVSDLLNPNRLILDSKFEKISGTRKQKLILAYRCAALTVVSDYLGIKLPLIIDSISRETDVENIDSIFSFLKGFEDHQIIVASILEIPGMNEIPVSYPLLKNKDLLSNVVKFD